MIAIGIFWPAANAAFGKTLPETQPRQQAPKETRALPARGDFPFGILGSFEFKTAKHRFQENWRDVLSRAGREKPLYRLCLSGGGDCPPKLKVWRTLIDELRGRPAMEQLARLNETVNRLVPYKDDQVAFNRSDHWATPREFFRSSGDCEDFAIIKFLSLLELGFDNDRLRVAIVRDRRRRLMHAVVTVRMGARVYVLDNLYNHPVEQRHILRYVPVYSANLEAQWAHVTTRKIRAAFVTHSLNLKADADRQARTRKERERVSGLKAGQSGATSGRASRDASRQFGSEKVVDWT